MSQRQENTVSVETDAGTALGNNNEGPITVLEQSNTEQQERRLPIAEINNNNMMIIDNELVEILVETWTN